MEKLTCLIVILYHFKTTKQGREKVEWIDANNKATNLVD